MRLSTGAQIHALEWNKIHINDCVVDCAEELSKEEDKTDMTNECPIIEWRPGTPIDNKDYIQDVVDMNEGDSQEASETDVQAYQYVNQR